MAILDIFKRKKHENILLDLYPGRQPEDDDPGRTPVGGAMPYVGTPHISPYLQEKDDPALTAEEELLAIDLPADRIGRYGVFETMVTDPTIESALKIHIANAFSANPETGEIISIESTSDKDDPIVEEIRSVFKDLFNQNARLWGWNAGLYGVFFSRIYGDDKRGVTFARSDYYSHPRNVRMFERAGRLAGYSSIHQQVERGAVPLMEPWKFVSFRVPFERVDGLNQPVAIDGREIHIDSDDYQDEPLTETTIYGSSLLGSAYKPWYDLQQAIIAMNASRANASLMERLVGANTGRLDHTKAAAYVNAVHKALTTGTRDSLAKAKKRGFTQTRRNILVPVWGEKGRLDISTVEGNPNIEGLEDVLFHVKRLGGALGIDPSMLGFGDMLSGGLGEGGWFRTSISAAKISESLRAAVQAGCERMIEIHLAYKHKKVYPQGERPWRLVFNSANTALDREQMENRELRANHATVLSTLVSTYDPEFSGADKEAFANYLWTDVLKVDEEKFKAMFPYKIAEEPPVGDGGGGDEFDSVVESALRKHFE